MCMIKKYCVVVALQIPNVCIIIFTFFCLIKYETYYSHYCLLLFNLINSMSGKSYVIIFLQNAVFHKNKTKQVY